MKITRYALCATLLFVAGFARPTLAGDWIYITRANDTLWDICLKYTSKRGCWIELASINKVDNERGMAIASEIRIPSEWLIEPVLVGYVLSYAGEVSLAHDGEPVAIAENQELHLGDRLTVGEGFVRIRLGASNEVLVRSHSEVTLENLSAVGSSHDAGELSVSRGTVEVSVEPGRDSRFEIRTPAAIAAVRGTRYRVNSSADENPDTRVEVLSGSVEMASSQSTLLAAGQGGLTSKSGDHIVAELLSAPDLDQSAYNGRQPVAIQWAQHGAAVAWQVDISIADASAHLVQSVRVDSSKYQLKNLEPGCYKVSVSAIDKQGFQGMERVVDACIEPGSKFDAAGAIIFIGTLLAIILI